MKKHNNKKVKWELYYNSEVDEVEIIQWKEGSDKEYKVYVEPSFIFDTQALNFVLTGNVEFLLNNKEELH